MLPEYQSHGKDDCLTLFPMCPIRLSNLPSFNRPFFPVKMGDFLQKAPNDSLEKREEINEQNSPLLSLPAIMTLAWIDAFCSLGRMEST